MSVFPWLFLISQTDLSVPWILWLYLLYFFLDMLVYMYIIMTYDKTVRSCVLMRRLSCPWTLTIIVLSAFQLVQLFVIVVCLTSVAQVWVSR